MRVLSIFVFTSYGAAFFLGSPFVIGAVTAFGDAFIHRIHSRVLDHIRAEAERR